MQKKPAKFRHLCAMASDILRAEPTIDDFEWRERIKDRIVLQRFEYPQPHELSAAMDAVNRAWTKRHGTRPFLLVTTPEPQRSPHLRLPSIPRCCAGTQEWTDLLELVEAQMMSIDFWFLERPPDDGDGSRPSPAPSRQTEPSTKSSRGERV